VTSLPPSLVRFESELEHAIRRQRSRRRRRLALRVAVAGCAATAAGLGAFSLLPGDTLVPGAGTSAVARAAAVIAGTEPTPSAGAAPAGGSILHIVTRTTSREPDGSARTWRSEAWQQTSPPYDMRRVDGDGGREEARADGATQIYNPYANTIYTTPREPVQGSAPALGPGERLRDAMLSMLRSGQAREDGRAGVRGREGIRIVSSAPRHVLVVDARTYEPLEWSLSSDEGIVETTSFEAYELLPATDANLASLSLTAQHPDARIEETSTSGDEGSGSGN
jgi:hypothetical protein